MSSLKIKQGMHICSAIAFLCTCAGLQAASPVSAASQAGPVTLTLICEYQTPENEHRQKIIDIDFKTSTILENDDARFRYSLTGIRTGNIIQRITELTPRKIEYVDEDVREGRAQHTVSINRVTGEYLYTNKTEYGVRKHHGTCRKFEGAKF